MDLIPNRLSADFNHHPPRFDSIAIDQWKNGNTAADKSRKVAKESDDVIRRRQRRHNVAKQNESNQIKVGLVQWVTRAIASQCK